MGHKTAPSAVRGTKVVEALTPEQTITELRKLRAAKLFVGDQTSIDVLLAEFDAVCLASQQLTHDLLAAQKANEQYIARNNELTDTMLQIKFANDSLSRRLAGKNLSEVVAEGLLLTPHVVALPPAGEPPVLTGTVDVKAVESGLADFLAADSPAQEAQGAVEKPEADVTGSL